MKLLRNLVSIGVVSIISTSISFESKPALAGCNLFGCSQSRVAECNPFGCPKLPLGEACSLLGCPPSPPLQPTQPQPQPVDVQTQPQSKSQPVDVQPQPQSQPVDVQPQPQPVYIQR